MTARAYACILLGLGLACNTSGAEPPAEVATVVRNLSVLCKGADEMLLSAMPGDYVSCSVLGEACNGFYIPGQGAVVQLRVAFPLVRPTTPAEVVAASAEASPEPPALVQVQPVSLRPNDSFEQHMEAMRRRARMSVARAVYNSQGSRPYDASACEELKHELATVLSNYVELLEAVPAGETVTLVVHGPCAAAPCAPPTNGDVSPLTMRPVFPSDATVPAAHFSMRLTTVRMRSLDDAPEGQSTLVGTIPRGKICIDPFETFRHMKFTAY